jgi:hypothetical protein
MNGRNLVKVLGVVGAASMVAFVPEAHAVAETYATDMATYISGDGKLTIMAVISATATLVAIFWIARKLGLR